MEATDVKCDFCDVVYLDRMSKRFHELTEHGIPGRRKRDNDNMNAERTQRLLDELFPNGESSLSFVHIWFDQSFRGDVLLENFIKQNTKI